MALTDKDAVSFTVYQHTVKKKSVTEGSQSVVWDEAESIIGSPLLNIDRIKLPF